MAEDYLDTGELVAIGAASTATEWIGIRTHRISENRRPLIKGYLPFDAIFQRWLGRENCGGKMNFLDSRTGGAFTAVGAGTLLFANNLAYPRDKKGRDVAQDLFLFVGGAFSTRGVTNIMKGIFARPRPFVHDSNFSDHSNDYSHDFRFNSFPSGHSSGAFFSSNYLNLRVRQTLRRELSPVDYRNWRWLSSGISFGWASFVGLTRIHANKHHFSDVATGSLIGILMSELFFSFNDNNQNGMSRQSSSPLMVTISFPI